MKKDVINNNWREYIIKETEHYYQGEMQQEVRASWLLGTGSALVAIFISLYLSSSEKAIIFSNIYMFIPLVSFFISAVLAILGLLPLIGTTLFKIPWRKKIITANQDLEKFIIGKFCPDSSWSELSLDDRIFRHFRSHYIRNYRKSIWVIFSSGFLLLGLIASIVCFIFIVY